MYKTALARGLSMIKVFVNSCIDTAARGANQSGNNGTEEQKYFKLNFMANLYKFFNVVLRKSKILPT